MKVGTSSATACIRIQELSLGKETFSSPPFRVNYKLTLMQQNLLRSLSSFFTEEMVRDVLHPYATQTSSVSLRCLDWLVTNHSKRENIVCMTEAGELFNIFHGYKLGLSNYRRRSFDPFRRRLRIFYTHEGEEFETTLGQANFLRFAHVNGVLRYAVGHKKEIEKDMNEANSAAKKDRQAMRGKGIVKKRKELTKQPNSKCSVYHVDTTVAFE